MRVAQKILCTFPGKHGDSLWALPTVRAIAEANGGPVDLLMAPKYAGLCELYKQQPYIRDAGSWPYWQVQEGAPMTPWSPFEETLHHEAIKIVTDRYDQVIHLGYRTWPPVALPHYVYQIAVNHYPLRLPPLDLDTPWITAAPWTEVPHRLVVGFSDEHFELKYGVTQLVSQAWSWPQMTAFVLAGPGSRWVSEAHMEPVDWIEAARRMVVADVFLGCCSALHVLAVATGTTAVIMEPAEARWNGIFWPLGKTGRVRLVLGGDGKPTFDARHVADCVREALHA